MRYASPSQTKCYFSSVLVMLESNSILIIYIDTNKYRRFETKMTTCFVESWTSWQLSREFWKLEEKNNMKHFCSTYKKSGHDDHWRRKALLHHLYLKKSMAEISKGWTMRSSFGRKSWALTEQNLPLSLFHSSYWRAQWQPPAALLITEDKA